MIKPFHFLNDSVEYSHNFNILYLHIWSDTPKVINKEMDGSGFKTRSTGWFHKTLVKINNSI